ncbi:nucleoside hydrolase [Deinococcus sp.]|uniref:nucleoside hydrolase n=1 Tax=Deinococcus sp. TaxID=47478 RepID=UPI0025D1FAE9|nr:nucleoside hydrolase [Deinococcus sp.]
MSTLLIHDCDPGIDDAVALLLALGSPELELKAVTTTHGNVSLRRTTRNALDLLAFAGRPDVPVHAGAAAPLVRAPVYAPEIHGQGGLGTVTLPEAGQPVQAEHAALALIRLAQAHPGQLSVCATGPLSNLALAERLQPGVLASLKEIVVMGGSLDTGAPKLGNVTPHAEFNTYADPHALRVVLESGADVVLFGLNLTRQVRVTRERIAALSALGTPAAQLCAGMLNGYLDMIEVRDQKVGALHDPCTVAYLLRPELFEVRSARIEVHLNEDEQLGMTVLAQGEPNVRLAVSADEDGVYALLSRRLG